MSPSSSSPPRFGVSDFERIYAASGDPWGYETSAYEREKYAATLAALPARPLGRVLEVGCSIGVFSEQLAGRCAELVAIDFAARALELARERLAGVGNVSLSRASFPEQTPPGEWDVVVCSEVLYYLDRPTLERALEWLAARLDRGATLVAVSWRGVGRDEPMSGDQAHELLLDRLGRWHTLDGATPSYRLDRFQRDDA